MPWVRLDSSFPEHPKVVGLTPAAFRLYVEMLCYAARNATDGFIPDGVVAARTAARQLEERKLWERHPDGAGWAIHDFLDWQESRRTREDRRDAAKRAARARWDNR